MKLGSYIVSVETFTHSQFQHQMLYGFRVTASQKVKGWGRGMRLGETYMFSLLTLLL